MLVFKHFKCLSVHIFIKEREISDGDNEIKEKERKMLKSVLTHSCLALSQHIDPLQCVCVCVGGIKMAEAQGYMLSMNKGEWHGLTKVSRWYWVGEQPGRQTVRQVDS